MEELVDVFVGCVPEMAGAAGVGLTPDQMRHFLRTCRTVRVRADCLGGFGRRQDGGRQSGLPFVLGLAQYASYTPSIDAQMSLIRFRMHILPAWSCSTPPARIRKRGVYYPVLLVYQL